MSLLRFGFSNSKSVAQSTATATKPAHSNQSNELPEERKKQKETYEKKRERKFLHSWKSTYPWLMYNEEENVMTCKACTDFPNKADKSSSFFKGSSSFRVHLVQFHSQSLHHKYCLEAGNARDNPRAAPLNAQIMRMEAGHREQLVHLFDLAYFVVKAEMSFATFPGLIRMAKKIGAEVGDSYSSDQALRRFIPFMYDTLHDDLLERLGDSKYISVMADSSTDSSVRDLELVYVRYLLDGVPTNCYMATRELEHATARGHLDCINEALIEHGLPNWKNCLVGFGSDGASTMIGANAGVTTLLRNEVPHLVSIHCLAHKLELGAADAIKDHDDMKQIKDVLDGIYKHYKYSPKAWRDIKALAAIMEEQVTKPGSMKGTRWLPHLSRALESLTKSFMVILGHMEHTIEDRNSSATMLGRARQVVRLLKNFKSLQFIFFLRDVLESLSFLSLKFQEDNANICSAIQAMETTVLTLTSFKYETGQHLAQFLEDSHEGSYQGIELTGFNDDNRQAFARARDRVIDGIVNHLGQRFQSFETNEVIAAAKVVQCQEWPRTVPELAQFGNAEVMTLCNHFVEILQRNDCDINEARHREWPDLKVFMRRQPAGYSWGNIFQDQDLVRRFANILQIIEIILVLPMSTATCERGFSTLKRVKTDWRSNLHPQMLDMLMYMCIEGPSCDEYVAATAMDRWWAGGERARRPVFQ